MCTHYFGFSVLNESDRWRLEYRVPLALPERPHHQCPCLQQLSPNSKNTNLRKICLNHSCQNADFPPQSDLILQKHRVYAWHRHFGQDGNPCERRHQQYLWVWCPDSDCPLSTSPIPQETHPPRNAHLQHRGVEKVESGEWRVERQRERTSEDQTEEK